MFAPGCFNRPYGTSDYFWWSRFPALKCWAIFETSLPDESAQPLHTSTRHIPLDGSNPSSIPLQRREIILHRLVEVLLGDLQRQLVVVAVVLDLLQQVAS